MNVGVIASWSPPARGPHSAQERPVRDPCVDRGGLRLGMSEPNRGNSGRSWSTGRVSLACGRGKRPLRLSSRPGTHHPCGVGSEDELAATAQSVFPDGIRAHVGAAGTRFIADLVRDDGTLIWPRFASGPDALLTLLSAEQRFLTEEVGSGSVPGDSYEDKARERLISSHGYALCPSQRRLILRQMTPPSAA
jgi:hypothetical protein